MVIEQRNKRPVALRILYSTLPIQGGTTIVFLISDKKNTINEVCKRGMGHNYKKNAGMRFMVIYTVAIYCGTDIVCSLI